MKKRMLFALALSAQLINPSTYAQQEIPPSLINEVGLAAVGLCGTMLVRVLDNIVVNNTTASLNPYYLDYKDKLTSYITSWFKKAKPASTFRVPGYAGAVDPEIEELVQLVQAIPEGTAQEDTEKRAFILQNIPKGYLLYGPPGTGKTYLAKCLADHLNIPFFSLNSSDFLSPQFNGTSSGLQFAFDELKKQALATPKKVGIIFIDEVDSIAGKRVDTDDLVSKESNKPVNQLLTLLDGTPSEVDKGKPENEVQIIMIAATNRKDSLDNAFLRPGRCDKHIKVDFPAYDDLLEMFKLYLQKYSLSAQAIDTFCTKEMPRHKNKIKKMTPSKIASIFRKLNIQFILARDQQIDWVKLLIAEINK